jgi:flavin-dependent dehydrogenase
VAVVLLETKAFPRQKVCGEFISPAVTGIIESLLGPGAMLRAGAARIADLVLHRDTRSVRWPLPAPAWTLGRATLDALLLDAARAAGAEVRQPARVSRVEYRDDGVWLEVNGQPGLAADLVIHADGSGRFDPGRAVPADPRVIGLKCQARLPNGPDGIHMRSTPGAYIGAVAVENGLTTIALLARSADPLARPRSADQLLAHHWPAFDPTQRATDWLACPVARHGYTAPGHPRSFRIGNAAAAVEPVGGEGIGLALWSGMRLGTQLAECLARSPDAAPADLARLQQSFARAYRRRLRTRIPACRAAGAVLMRPRLVAALWPLVEWPGVLLRPWYALTGKTDQSPALGGS